jgi:multiple sugar transport system permease protein
MSSDSSSVSRFATDVRASAVTSPAAPTAPPQVAERARTAVAPRRRRRRKIGAGDVVAWTFLIALVLFAGIPLLWMLSTSLKGQFAAMQQPPRWIPTEPRLEHYQQLLDPNGTIGQEFLRYLRNSFWVSLATTLLGIFVAVPAAYAFSRFTFPGRDALFFSVLVRNMFPVVVFLTPLFVLMRKLELVGTHWSLILTYLTFGLPLSIWLLKGFYDNIPPELEMAARIDGASRFQAFWIIVMPLSSPGIIATAIYAFIGAWNEYVYAFTFLTEKRLLTMPVGLQRFFSENTTNWPGLMAASFIMSVPVVVLFLLLQKYFVKALTEGAVKT